MGCYPSHPHPHARWHTGPSVVVVAGPRRPFAARSHMTTTTHTTASVPMRTSQYGAGPAVYPGGGGGGYGGKKVTTTTSTMMRGGRRGRRC
ncbi:hypothetical protein JCM3775_002149 [Rhodotorula graminis]|uniref:Uncharacterized protein n=1 Tax=Rhodotorula graminis (strain WP1) TaxID=578459 RepID=A0A0P9EWV1_RHOGW|nr:uncharacterized protein RHOBADRAFT_47557 [Rhodotorula graminis WP1]KPV71603.1 hypothetical protein RHOBADRAFT_47557 [Rhodotorula graminis WP1]